MAETYDETLAQMRRLLNLLPSVEVVGAYVTRGTRQVHIDMQVRSQESLALLAWISRGANVFVSVELAGWDANADKLRYSLRLEKEAETVDPPNELQRVGVILVRCLKQRGWLASDEADSLQRAWNALPLDYPRQP